MLHFLPGVTIQRNDMIQAFRGNQPRFFQDERTLSKKDRGVKVFKYFKYFNLDGFTKESIIEQTYLSENLPCPLFAKEGYSSLFNGEGRRGLASMSI
jgi:hypothetical protein